MPMLGTKGAGSAFGFGLTGRRSDTSPPGPAAPDGALSTASTANAASSLSASISTTYAGEIIVAFVAMTLFNATQYTSTVTGGGLTWALRKRHQWTDGSSRKHTIEEWWAYAATKLTAASITATFSRNLYATLGVLALTGEASTSAPYDANAAVPATKNGSGTYPNFSAYSTDAKALGLVCNILLDSFSVPSVTTGWSDLGTAYAAGANSIGMEVSYKYFSSAQSGLTGTCSGNLGIYGVIADAVDSAV